MTEFNFKDFYKGTESELKEDIELLKILKRQISLYLKENTSERLHGIFNKLYILRKSIDKDKFYDFLLSEMRSEETKKLTEFIMKEGLLLGTFEGDIPINWKLHLDEIKKEVKIKGGIKNEGNRFT